MINSYWLKRAPAQASLRRFNRPALFAFVLALNYTPVPSRAATPPPTTLLYTAPASASIHGGVATIGTSGVTYFSILSTGSTRAKVIKLSASGTPLWTFTAPGDGTGYDMYAIPSLDAAGAKLYIGSDAGIFYCLNTSDGSVAWSYPVPTGTDKRIRSGAALDPNNVLGATVYFHCNNGYLYALNAATGAWRWTATTGNAGGPPVDTTWDPHPVSSSPVVDSSGVIYVGSADGSVYAFNPSNGSQKWRVVLNTSAIEPVEATIALGRDGILFVATRANPEFSGVGGNVYAIDPVTHAVVWPFTPGGDVGFIASPVIDQSGFVYAAHFDHNIYKLKAANGFSLQSWFIPAGKLCQTPSINQNGLLIFGVSAMGGLGEVSEIAAVNTADPNSFSPLWEITQTGGQSFGNSFGSPAMVCVLGGTAYFADTLGKVCSFDTGAPMMAGTWPTFECGNRRAGKTLTYPTALAQLPAYYENAFTDVHRLDSIGRAVGQAQGYYLSYCGYLDTGYAAAWLLPQRPRLRARVAGRRQQHHLLHNSARPDRVRQRHCHLHQFCQHHLRHRLERPQLPSGSLGEVRRFVADGSGFRRAARR